ncbi:MAG TPA: PfkB family carbohydrate kinase [Gemmatimonadaceae bacterium]|nr:PfkB family carbohydrate kinase [Gemmatimonadaceae bacterium]
MPLTISRDRLDQLLDAASRTRIVAVGDAMLDEYLVGDVERISPEAPVPVVRVRERRYALGGVANVAQNVVATGAECMLIAAMGDDTAGQQLGAMLGEMGISKRWMVSVARPTTRKTRVVARSQQLVRIDDEEDTDLTVAEARRITTAIEAAVENADALILEDYNKGVLIPTVITHAIEVARARKIPVIVDPKYRHFFAYRGATVFKPNRRELDSALGAEVDLEHPEAIPTAIQRLSVEYLLLTLGERGMLLAGKDGSLESVATVAREVYDVVGAGDTVTAYLAAILGAGGTAAEAAVIANYAAGVEVGKLGAATVSPSEVVEAYEHFATQRELPSSDTRTTAEVLKG